MTTGFSGQQKEAILGSPGIRREPEWFPEHQEEIRI